MENPYDTFSDGTDSITYGTGNTIPYTVSTDTKARRYKCPKCEGEFNSWNSTWYHINNPDELMYKRNIAGNPKHSSEYKKVLVCPFCETQQGDY